MNQNDVDLEAAAQAQAELAQKQYQARVDWLQKRASQAARNLGESAKRIVTSRPFGDSLQPAPMKAKKETWNCRIELFRMEDKRPVAHNILVETAGENLAEAVAGVVERIRKGEVSFEKRVGY
jgi:hypothetical protein